MPAGAKPDARGICVYSASPRVNANGILARRPARSPIRTAEILARAWSHPAPARRDAYSRRPISRSRIPASVVPLMATPRGSRDSPRCAAAQETRSDVRVRPLPIFYSPSVESCLFMCGAYMCIYIILGFSFAWYSFFRTTVSFFFFFNSFSLHAFARYFSLPFMSLFHSLACLTRLPLQ
jgi:hypothetical protein